jgi:large subunit ribosomal protein L2
MTIIKRKPTSPGRRGMVSVIGPKTKPIVKRLLVPKTRRCGRSAGTISVRHQGGGAKRHYRIIDFKRDKHDVLGTVYQIEYDPNRSAHIALVIYEDHDRRYIVAPDGLKKGDVILAGVEAPVQLGNAMPLGVIPLGTFVHCIELTPGRGAQLVRSAGASAQILGREANYVLVRLRSTEVRKIHASCWATVGSVSNMNHNLRCYGKAGAKRWRGIRPTVRGVAMNPVDHPMGGGEGKTSGGRHPCTPWGKSTKGLRTRKVNKPSRHFIVRRRNKH